MDEDTVLKMMTWLGARTVLLGALFGLQGCAGVGNFYPYSLPGAAPVIVMRPVHQSDDSDAFPKDVFGGSFGGRFGGGLKGGRNGSAEHSSHSSDAQGKVIAAQLRKALLRMWPATEPSNEPSKTPSLLAPLHPPILTLEPHIKSTVAEIGYQGAARALQTTLTIYYRLASQEDSKQGSKGDLKGDSSGKILDQGSVAVSDLYFFTLANYYSHALAQKRQRYCLAQQGAKAVYNAVYGRATKALQTLTKTNLTDRGRTTTLNS